MWKQANFGFNRAPVKNSKNSSQYYLIFKKKCMNLAPCLQV